VEKIVLPLTPTDMVEFFKDKNQAYLIDYHASLANLSNPKFLLMYIANLGLNCNIDVITHELMDEYMRLKEFSEVQNLKITHANILGLAKHGDMFYTDHPHLWSIDECIDFATQHHSLLIPQMAFVNSIPLYMLTKLGAGEGEEFGPLHDTLITTVTDEQFDEIGYSVVKLFTIKDFLMAYLCTNIPLSDQIYYTRYFDEYMFNGGNIFSYVFNDKSAYAGLITLAAEMDAGDTVAGDKIKQLMIDMQAMLPIPDDAV